MWSDAHSITLTFLKISVNIYYFVFTPVYTINSVASTKNAVLLN